MHRGTGCRKTVFFNNLLVLEQERDLHASNSSSCRAGFTGRPTPNPTPMIVRLLLLLAFIGGLWWFLRWFRRTPSPEVARRLRRGAIYGAIALLLVLAATGRLNWIPAAIGSVVGIAMRFGPALLKLLPLVSGMRGAARPGGSVFSTAALRVTTDRGGRLLDGEILAGEEAGRRLSQLGLDELRRLWESWNGRDRESAALLAAWVAQHHGEQWQAHGTPPAGGSSAMSREEALQVLGLEPDADAAQIREAHRRLMQKIHPDRGGSPWLAARLNQARDVLLQEK